MYMQTHMHTIIHISASKTSTRLLCSCQNGTAGVASVFSFFPSFFRSMRFLNTSETKKRRRSLIESQNNPLHYRQSPVEMPWTS